MISGKTFSISKRSKLPKETNCHIKLYGNTDKVTPFQIKLSYRYRTEIKKAHIFM